MMMVMVILLLLLLMKMIDENVLSTSEQANASKIFSKYALTAFRFCLQRDCKPLFYPLSLI